ncbi:MAG: energy transducer TonB [Flavobacteriaceae bacterium]|nr:energy transducer TonB [Flavobacteriaceae bacterium]
MKKQILIFSTVLIAVSLTAIALINKIDFSSEPLETSMNTETIVSEEEPEDVQNVKVFSDFIYDIGSRFYTMTKSDIDNLRAFGDIIGEEHSNRIVSYDILKVSLFENDEATNTIEIKNTDEFNPAQLELLQSLGYSANLLIWAEYQIYANVTSGELKEEHWTPYITIVPEKQAEYTDGKEALMIFLRESSKESRRDVDPNDFRPAKLYFTVTKNGTIENVSLDRSSNFPEVDAKMIELISKTPGQWIPAENSKGEKVDQEFVVSFGLLGC